LCGGQLNAWLSIAAAIVALVAAAVLFLHVSRRDERVSARDR
jgi:hypothetical protein